MGGSTPDLLRYVQALEGRIKRLQARIHELEALLAQATDAPR